MNQSFGPKKLALKNLDTSNHQKITRSLVTSPIQEIPLPQAVPQLVVAKPPPKKAAGGSWEKVDPLAQELKRLEKEHIENKKMVAPSVNHLQCSIV